MKYILMQDLDKNYTFTFVGDERLETAFSNYTILGEITEEKHSELLNALNNVSWDKKIKINPDFTVTEEEKYFPEEKANILLEQEKEKEKTFFNNEREVALRIEQDKRLQLEPITDEEMNQVIKYMQSIKPKRDTMVLIAIEKVERPAIMYLYDKII